MLATNEFDRLTMDRHNFDLMYADATHHPRCSLTCQASPSVQSEILSRDRSLMRACPGDAERAGKPPAFDSQRPGAVTRKLRVVRNFPTAKAMPRAETRGESGRARRPRRSRYDQHGGRAAPTRLPMISQYGVLLFMGVTWVRV